MSEPLTSNPPLVQALEAENAELRRINDRLRAALEDACLTFAVHGDQPPQKWLDALAGAAVETTGERKACGCAGPAWYGCSHDSK